jgi:hypothetical protein
MDYDAVAAGLTLPYSSGAVEGKNCKINYLKRLMYGRANFDLLRKMTLLTSLHHRTQPLPIKRDRAEFQAATTPPRAPRHYVDRWFMRS